MKNTFFGILAFTCLILSSLSSKVYAGGSINLMGAVGYSRAEGTPSPTGKWGFPGGGLILGIGLGSRAQIELGGLFLTRSYTLGGAESITQMLQGQVGLRFILSRALIFNLGGYYNYYHTNPNYFTGNDVGAYGGLGLRLPLGGASALLINPQYHYAINTLTYSGGTISPHEVLILVGFSFGKRSK